MNERLVSAFAARFQRRAEVFAAAPGRLEILGNHTDYNEGFVLSCAVDQRTMCVAAPNHTGRVNFFDLRAQAAGSFDLHNLTLPLAPKWLGYPAGVISELAGRGCAVQGFDAMIDSTVPLSAGMSSSAALETAILYALCALYGFEFSKADLARIGQGVENNFLGLKTGLLDQFSSIFGVKDAFILSDFRTVEVLKTVPMAPGCAILVVNSMKKHNLVDSEYNVRRAACESAAAKLAARHPEVRTLRDVTSALLTEEKPLLTDTEYRRALHVTSECERVMQAEKFLAAGDVESFGRLWWESAESSRVNFENSSPEIDRLIGFSHEIPGALGARLSGGGFGGITIHLVREEALDAYQKEIAARFAAEYHVKPEMIVSHPGAGAETLKL